MSMNTDMRPRVFALANQTGGVGKTTTAINLATALAAVGEDVLLLDLDPQGNASTGLGVEADDRTISAYELLSGEVSLLDAVQATAVPRLHIVPATMDLLGLEMEISDDRDRPYRLKKAIAAHLGRKPDFTYILIDCPPSLNLLTLNALAAADSVLVPLQTEFFALEGLSQLMRTVEQVKSTVNNKLELQGIVLTMFDKRNNLAVQVVEDTRATLGSLVYDTIIPRNVRISEAPSFGKPVLLYDINCAGSQSYLKLASEMIQREKKIFASHEKS
ncbi:MAG: ParA family protein [Pseudomonadota bacterium]